MCVHFEYLFVSVSYFLNLRPFSSCSRIVLNKLGLTSPDLGSYLIVSCQNSVATPFSVLSCLFLLHVSLPRWTKIFVRLGRFLLFLNAKRFALLLTGMRPARTSVFTTLQNIRTSIIRLSLVVLLILNIITHDLLIALTSYIFIFVICLDTRHIAQFWAMWSLGITVTLFD
jgi:hypothetical protein